MVKRKYPVGLQKKSLPHPDKLKHRHFIYEIIGSPYRKQLQPLDVILMDYVEGIGNKGERLTLKHSIAYNKLLLPGLAVYASPENIAKYANVEEKKDKFSSPYVERTLNILATRLVIIEMNIKQSWTLEKWHVNCALRRHGIYLPLDAITMPDHVITGPNLELMENKEFFIKITINNRETMNVRCRIHHVHRNPILSANLDPNYFLYPAEAIFPDDKPILDSMLRHRLCKINETKTEN